MRLHALLALTTGAGLLAAARAEPSAVDLEFFEKKVRPILVERCYECHSAEAGKSKGGLTGAGLQKIGGSGEMNLDVPITISGTASNPVIKADSGAVAKQAAATAAKSAVEKYVPGEAGKAAGSILGGFLGGKKKR